MSDAQDTKNGVSRRDFLKIAGLAGLAVQAGGFVAGGIAAGSSSETYTGWESNNPGTQFFNRKPFEVEGPVFKPVGEVRRPSHMTDYVFGRVATFQKALEANPTWTIEDPIEDMGFPPPMVEFYKKFPERLDWDYKTFTETIPNNGEDRKQYGAYYHLIDVYEAGFGAIRPVSPDSPPEEYDFTTIGRGGGQPLGEKLPFKSPELAAEFVKEISHRFGATLVRITKPNIDWHYGDGWRGCPPEYDHSKLPAHYKSAIVIGVPMEWDEVLGSPQMSTSQDAYARVSIAGIRIEGALKKMGYATRASTPNNGYDVVVPPYAVDAGLGEHCRAGYVITPETGSNCRTAVILTNLELAEDKPIEFGVKEFCQKCKICAEQCPSGAISFADNYDGLEIRGYEHWYINNGACYNFWRESMGGMGCRLCVANCPYSRKDNWLHDLSRELDPRDPTGTVSSTLLWMQKNFFDAPEALEYRRIAEGGKFAQYRKEPFWLQGETYLDIDIVDPKES
ncbi:MAG: reductive dehalogenase [Chloroflexi bacterium]|nr:MAG: reductive dehalogenase [Chloroflexota bacterium]